MIHFAPALAPAVALAMPPTIPCRLVVLRLLVEGCRPWFARMRRCPVLTVDRSYPTLDAAVTYDCFIFTQSPQGKEKCRYVGSTDIGCFEADPVSIESTSGPVVVFDDLVQDAPLYGLEIDYEMLGVGNPPIEPGLADSLGFLCLEGPYAACPSSWLTSDLLTLPFPSYPSTTGGSLVFANDTYLGSDVIAGTNTTPDEGAPVVLNTLYTCFSVLENTCSPTSAPTCSDPVELISPPALALPAGQPVIITRTGIPGNSTLFAYAAVGQVNATCDRTYAIDQEGDALEVFNMWTCTGAGAWFPIDCDGTPQTRAITGFDGNTTTQVDCTLWQGQGENGGGCHPDSPDQCNWQASGADVPYNSFWSDTVVFPVGP